MTPTARELELQGGDRVALIDTHFAWSENRAVPAGSRATIKSTVINSNFVVIRLDLGGSIAIYSNLLRRLTLVELAGDLA